ISISMKNGSHIEYSDPPNCVPTKFRFQAESFISTSTTVRSGATCVTETPAPRYGGEKRISFRNRALPRRGAIRWRRVVFGTMPEGPRQGEIFAMAVLPAAQIPAFAVEENLPPPH